MKKINNFKSSWSGISDIIHDMKSALTLLNSSQHQSKRAMKKIIDGLEKIDKAIYQIANGEDSAKNT